MSIMHTMSSSEKTIYKAQKIKAVRDYHSDLIKEQGVTIYDFNMKTKFLDEQGNLVVGIFASEFKKSKGFFFELIDSDLNPTDPERKVYRVPPSNSFDEEYELNYKGSYLVPLEELRVVNSSSVAKNKSLSSALISNDNVFKVTQKAQEEQRNFVNQEQSVQKAPALMEDAPYSTMTIRDYFAIYTGTPVSSRPWLNDLIKNK